MTKNELNVDASILQFTPNGEFYNTAEEKAAAYNETVDGLFDFNRVLFALLGMLPGTAYSHGVFAHKLLSNPQLPDGNSTAIIQAGVDPDYEVRIILLALKRETQPRALKNLLMLTGKGSYRPINNTRARRVIMSFLFDRDARSLDSLVTKYKAKVATLLRHAVGIQHLSAMLDENENMDRRIDLYEKHIGKYFKNGNGLVPVYHLFNKTWPADISGTTQFPKVVSYRALRVLAKSMDSKKFLEVYKRSNLPVEIGIGFKNTFKLNLTNADIMDTGRKTERQKIQMQTAAKRAGTKIAIDYHKQDIYDLWKYFYHELFKTDTDTRDLSMIYDAITTNTNNKLPLDLGDIGIIFDVSRSMLGTEDRKLHPFLTSLSIISALDNIAAVKYVGGKMMDTGMFLAPKAIVPEDSEEELTPELLEALALKVDTIIVISGGYNKEINEAFYHYYSDGLKKNVDILHINPLYDATIGGTKTINPNIKPMAVNDYKHLETNLVFDLLTSHPEEIIGLLAGRYVKLLKPRIR